MSASRAMGVRKPAYEASPEVIRLLAGRPECWTAVEEVGDVEAVIRRPIWVGRGWGCRNGRNAEIGAGGGVPHPFGMDFCIFCISCI